MQFQNFKIKSCIFPFKTFLVTTLTWLLVSRLEHLCWPQHPPPPLDRPLPAEDVAVEGPARHQGDEAVEEKLAGKRKEAICFGN